MSYSENTGNMRGGYPEALLSKEALTDDEALHYLAKMNIILLGIPGAGKTTLSEELMSRNDDIDYISVGEISRNLAPNSPERLYLNELFKGEAPTGDPDFFLHLIEKRIDHARGRGNGFILDGIPKKIEEVQPLLRFLEAKDIKIDAVIACDISPTEAYDRVASRGGRAGDEDSMTIFMNRTKTYLASINEFKMLLTSDSAQLFTLDTELLDQEESINRLLSLVKSAIVEDDIAIR